MAVSIARRRLGQARRQGTEGLVGLGSTAHVVRLAVATVSSALLLGALPAGASTRSASEGAGSAAAPVTALWSCTGRRVVEPTEFVISCADANSELTSTRWTSWTATRATGTTRFGLNLCVPYCAASPMSYFPNSTVVASRPEATRHGELFSSLTVTYELKGRMKTFSFSWAGTPAFAAAAPCRPSQLIGNFSLVANSEGVGNVTYALELINRSSTPCTLRGVPGMQLLGASSNPLPTHVLPTSLLGGVGPVAVRTLTLGHGVPAWASARFSPDVPGVGEPTSGARCEAIAYRLEVWVGGRRGPAVVVPVRPPNPVCEHGTMQVSPLSRARPTA